MSQLSWADEENRTFELGVDRGVLYVDGLGYAWNGLISINEEPDGGEARPHYLDGVKFLNLAMEEEFRATIEAFSSPQAFNECDGTKAIHNGLYATQQPRKPFGMSYRTRIGNSVDGPNHGYKIHLIYNALASPASRSHSTMSDQAEPSVFSWEISTLPPELTGFKPTAHLIIDSRTTASGILEEVEDLLYGTSESDPVLPAPSAIVEIFAP